MSTAQPLLSQQSCGHFDFTVAKAYQDCPVFVHGRIFKDHQLDQASFPYQLLHKADSSVVENHWPMSSTEFNNTLKEVLEQLGLQEAVTTRVLCWSYAMKVIAEGKLPGWEILQQMGHFGRQEAGLWRRDYVPDRLPKQTTQASGKDVPKGAKEALALNRAVELLPRRELILQAYLQEAKLASTTSLEALHTMSQGNGTAFPSKEANLIIDTFRQLNGGRALPLEDSLAQLLALTTKIIVPNKLPQVHPFDNVDIHSGEVLCLLQWLTLGAHLLCPLCNTMLHLEKLTRSN